eukprot:349547-Hanusia_phi.AAC.3
MASAIDFSCRSRQLALSLSRLDVVVVRGRVDEAIPQLERLQHLQLRLPVEPVSHRSHAKGL